ncbi:MAG TPA: hypothetical protein VMV10_04140 [Pirellulales bacterium]|nr:hypothetical protein [Pirellulales bacterium]
MRYLLILILACLPLVVLTIASFVEAFGPEPPLDAAAQDAQLAEARKLAADTAQAAAAEAPLVEALAKTDLLARQPHALPATESDTLGAIVETWKRSEHARSLAMNCLTALPPPVEDDAPAAARRRGADLAARRLQDFLAAEREPAATHGLGADTFFKLVAERSKRLENEVAQYKREDNIASALDQAADDLNAGRYEACLALLASEPLGGLHEGDVGERVDALRKRAEYRQAAEELISRRPDGEADRDLKRAIESFLRRYPTPPSPAEADLRTQLLHRRDALTLAITIAELADPPDLETLLVQAAAIFEQPGVDEATRQRVRAQAVEWLDAKGFPRLEPPTDLIGKQEAITKSAQRKIGIFFLPTGAEQWRFWTDREHRKLRPRGDEQIARDSFDRPPGTPQYVVWAQQYNDASAKLIRQGGSRDDWQDFARQCEAWEQELTSYREAWGVDEPPDRACRRWSFLGAAATARTIVERWRQFEQVLAKPSST